MTTKGKTILITGSTDGVGRYVAERLAAQGWGVIVHGRDRARGEAVVERIAQQGGKARFLVADDFQDNVARLRRGGRPMDMRAARLQFPCKFLQVFVEMIDRLPFRFRGGLPRNLPVLEFRLLRAARNLVFFQRSLDDLKEKLLVMAGMAEQSIQRAVEAYRTRDLSICDLVDRSDNYYVYLKPHDAVDSEIQKKLKFPGPPPVWIPMPPH